MNNKVLNNTKWILLCKIIQAFLSLIISMLSARYLGPSNFGIINYAASVVAFVMPIMQLGISNILVRELVDRPEEEGEILGSAIGLSCMSALFCILGVTAFAYLANPGDESTIGVCFLYSLLLIFQALEMIQYWFQAKLLSKYTSLVALGAYGVVTVYKIVLLILGKSVYWFAVSNALDYMIIAVCLVFFYKKLGGKKFSFSRHAAKRLFSTGKYYIVSSMMVTIFAQTDKIMIKGMIDETAVGYYSAAVACAGMTSFVFSAIIDSVRPVILEKKRTENLGYKVDVSRLYSIIIYLALAQSVVMTVFSKYIVLILYGKQYMASVSALQIIVWYTTFSYIGGVRAVWILAEKKHHFLWIVNLSGALLNIVLNLMLIPRFGINGAATASLITQIFANIIMGYIVPAFRENNALLFKGANPHMFISIVKSILRTRGRRNYVQK